MAEALVTGLGLLLAAIATIVSLVAGDKSNVAKRVLIGIALSGLIAGGITTWVQYQARMDDQKRANKAEDDLSALKNKMTALGITDEETSRKVNDLTMLDQLGGGSYYVVIDTFKKNSAPDTASYNNVLGNINTLYPDAQSHGLLWTKDVGGTHFELRFGRHLTPSAAEIFLRLADQGGLANGKAQIRRE